MTVFRVGRTVVPASRGAQLALLAVIALVLIVPTGAWATPAPLARPAGPSASSESDVGAAQLRAAEASLAPLPAPGAAPTPWINLTATLNASPSPREGSAFVYDVADGYVLLFGGLTAHGATHDTWKYLNGVWTNLTPTLSVSPPNRYKGGIAYDAHDGYVVLFGGRTSIYRNDTWKWSGGQWTPLPETTAPAAREDSMMAYDAADGYVVVYGGELVNSYLENDTWTFQGGVWTNITSSLTTYPSNREAGAFTYDSTDGYLVLFGGKPGNSGTLHDTWSFSGGKWTNITTLIVNSPPQRESPMLADDPVDGFVLLYGGLRYPTAYSDEWEYAHYTWTQVIGPTPPARFDGSMVYDPNNGTGFDLLFGGVTSPLANGTELNDTWSFKLPLYPTLAPVLPTTVDLGQPIAINLTVSGGYAPYELGWTGLPAGCQGGNVSAIECVPSAIGVDSVVAWAHDAVGTNVSTTALNITVNAYPTISPSVSPAMGPMPFVINFQAGESGGTPPITYNWTFGDGQNSSSASGTHTYGSAGSYPTALTVLDGAGTVLVASGLPTIVVTDQLSVAPSANPTSGAVPLPVTFSAGVAGGSPPYAYSWTFGPAGATASSASPTYTYTSAGTYPVTVNVTDALGHSVASGLTIQATASTPLTASAVASPSSGTAPVDVAFTGSASGGSAPYTYAWSFGPSGASSTAQNPSYTYTVAGAFTATLTVRDSKGTTATASAPVTVASAAPFTANFSAIVGASYCSAGTGFTPINLTAAIEGGTAPYTYTWGFPSEPTASTPTVSEVVPAGAIYTVTLTVDDSGGHHAAAPSQNLTAASVSCTTPSGTTSSGTNYLFWAVLIAILVVIIVEVALLLRKKK